MAFCTKKLAKTAFSAQVLLAHYSPALSLSLSYFIHTHDRKKALDTNTNKYISISSTRMFYILSSFLTFTGSIHFMSSYNCYLIKKSISPIFAALEMNHILNLLERVLKVLKHYYLLYYMSFILFK